MKGVYRFAQKNIEIRSVGPSVHRYCSAWRTDAAPDFAVTTTAEDIARERALSAAADASQHRQTRVHPDGYLERLAVYRAIAERMPLYDTVLFHGSALAVDGEGYLFTAPSGTGKSTHARLWRELLGERVVMINDDKPLLRVAPGGVTVYGTPFRGKHALGGDVSAPLRAICLLSRGKENAIRPVSPAEAYPTLLGQIYRPTDGAAMSATLSLLDRLCGTVRFFALECNMDLSAAQTAYEAIRIK